MDPSSWIFILGVALLLIPVPPFATIAGLATIGIGAIVLLLGA